MHLRQVGFCTVYLFYAYPHSVRLRVSQILVLPPFQKQGVGKLLLQSVYHMAHQRGALDVTVSTLLLADSFIWMGSLTSLDAVCNTCMQACSVITLWKIPLRSSCLPACRLKIATPRTARLTVA